MNPIHRSKLRRATCVLVLVATWVSGCGAKQEAPEPRPLRPVATVVFGDSGHRSSHQYPGRLHADRRAELAFEVGGRVVEIDVARGAAVERGQRLAVLDRRDLAQALQSARAVHAEARASLARYLAVEATGAVSPHEIDLARARERVAASQLAVRRKALADAELIAPFDGVVATRHVDDFEQVQPGQPVLSLQSVSSLEVRIDVPERDMLGVDPSAPGRMVASFDVAPERRFDLTLKEYVTESDPVTQTFPITLRMERPDDLELLPGMTATVTWTPERSGADRLRTLPASAVLGAPGQGSWVFVVDGDGGQVSRREVRIGAPVGDGALEVLEGLAPGERVARAGVHHLHDGMRVRADRMREEG